MCQDEGCETRKAPEPGLKVVPAQDIKLVSKPWGWEKWIAGGGPDFPYMSKIIHIRAPHRTSLQFHERKQESNHLLAGHAVLHFSEVPIDARRFKAGGYGPEELALLIARLRARALGPGDTIHVPPGYLHRIETSEEDITLVETSTDHADDVYRLEDDTNRTHGRIEQEHG